MTDLKSLQPTSKWRAAALKTLSARSGSLKGLVFASACIAFGLRILQKYDFWLSRVVVTRLLGFGQMKKGPIQRLDFIMDSVRANCKFAATAYIRKERPAPTMVIRSPYGKSNALFLAYGVACQGFNVVIQDCRGRFASSGEWGFGAFEDIDGLETLELLAEQGFDWYDPNRVVTFGISYLGITQWAIVAGFKRRRELRNSSKNSKAILPIAIAPLFSASRVHDAIFENNAFRLDFYLKYWHLVNVKTTALAQILLVFSVIKFQRQLKRHIVTTLGAEKLHKNLGLPMMYKYNARPTSRFWVNRDYSDAISVTPPVFIGTGWFDLFLGSSLKDFAAVVKGSGVGHARLLIGPWHHLESILNFSAFKKLLQESVAFLQEKVGMDDSGFRLPVRLWIMHERSTKGRWQDFSAWPPNEVKEDFFVLGPGSLHNDAVDDQRAHANGCQKTKNSFVYDPLDPTPTVGGNIFDARFAGEQLQSPLEQRKDILIFDTQPLTEDTTIIGCARLRLSLRASRPMFDVFSRLVDVHPNGVESYNVCDAIIRHQGPTARCRSQNELHRAMDDVGGNSYPVTLEFVFGATAKCFKMGHRIRLIVAGASFPQFARHLGDVEQTVEPEPLEIHKCTIEVVHDDAAPSALWLPVLRSPGSPRSLKQAAAARSVRKMPPDFMMGLRAVQSETVIADSI